MSSVKASGVSTGGLSISLPLAKDSNDGPFKSNKNLEDLSEQNLKMIILTHPGERVMNPDFGVGLKRFLFEPATPFLVEEVRNSIMIQVKRYAPYVQIRSLDVDMDPDNSMLLVKISYAVPAGGIVSNLTIPVSA